MLISLKNNNYVNYINNTNTQYKIKVEKKSINIGKVNKMFQTGSVLLSYSQGCCNISPKDKFNTTS